MAETTIRADGKSPLSCYVDLLVLVPADLKLRLDRDAEAVRILTAAPALPEAIRRAERWYWDRWREKRNGGIVLTRRIWTRRDERRVNMLRGLSEGYWPPCRAARYLDRLQPGSGVSPHDKWFRLAVDEARRDGTAAVLCPLMAQTNAIYERLVSAARSVAQDDDRRSDFDSARSELGNLACELMKWMKQPGPSSTTPALRDDGDIQRQIAEGFRVAHAALAADRHSDEQAEPAMPTDPTSKSERRAEWLAKAMLLVQDHPDWSDTEIARKVGKNGSTLSRNKTYRVAAAMARSAKGDRPEGHHTVTPDTGQLGVEAVDNNKHGDRGQPIKGSKYYREYCAECDEPIKVASDEVGENPRCKDCEK
jgi:hypothetical protein